MISIEQAIDLIEESLKLSGYNIIPDIPAFRVKDLFEIYQEEFGLEYKIGQPRISEKLHEMMFSIEESTRVKKHNKTYLMHYRDIAGEELPFREFTSDKVCVTKEDLKQLLHDSNYFKPH